MDTGVQENAADKRMIDGELMQAESSESSSGHSDKDWIRYSKTGSQACKLRVQLCSPSVCMHLCGLLLDKTLHNFGSFRYGGVVNPATSHKLFTLSITSVALAQHAISC